MRGYFLIQEKSFLATRFGTGRRRYVCLKLRSEKIRTGIEDDGKETGTLVSSPSTHIKYQKIWVWLSWRIQLSEHRPGVPCMDASRVEIMNSRPEAQALASFEEEESGARSYLPFFFFFRQYPTDFYWTLKTMVGNENIDGNAFPS